MSLGAASAVSLPRMKQPCSVAVSQVTHLFRDVLHGWGQIMLSVNVSPCAKDYDETSHVLKVMLRMLYTR